MASTTENKNGVEYVGMGHINIVVDDIYEAISFYKALLGAEPFQIFKRFQNIGFSKAAGFLNGFDNVSVTICFLIIPVVDITLELMQYHSPQGKKYEFNLNVNDISGVRHVALKVKNIDKAFEHIKTHTGVRLINQSPDYRPYKIDSITPDDFSFFDMNMENSQREKDKVCHTVENIRYFYFVDKYGVQWEFEEGHTDIGSTINT